MRPYGQKRIGYGDDGKFGRNREKTMAREPLIDDDDFPDVAAHPEDAFLDGYEAGAAVAFGIIGMAEAIRANDRVRACPLCGKASQNRVWPSYQQPHPHPFGWVCMRCFADSQWKKAPDSPGLGPEGKKES